MNRYLLDTFCKWTYKINGYKQLVQSVADGLAQLAGRFVGENFPKKKNVYNGHR